MKTLVKTNLALFFRAGLISISVLTILIFRNIWAYEWPGDLLSFIYVPLAISGQAYLMHVLLLIPFLAILWLPVRLFRWILLLTLGVFQFLFLVDGYIFNLYRFHIDLFFIKMFFVDFAGLGIGWMSVIAGLLVLGFVVALNAIAHDKLRTQLSRGRTSLSWLLLLLTMLTGQMVHAYGHAHNYKQITSLTYVIPWYTPLTADTDLMKWGLVDKDLRAENLNISIKTNGSFEYPKKSLSCTPSKHKPNILFVVLESWRFDRLSQDISPHIWDIGKQSLMFTQHLSGGNVTTQGMFSLLYGTSPVYWRDAISTAAEPALISTLKQQDYQFYILANQNIEVTKLQELLFKGITPIQNVGDSNVTRGDIAITEKFLAGLDKSAGPFFGLLFYNSSHSPYTTPKNYKKPFLPARQINLAMMATNADATPYLNQYANAVHFEDSLVGTLRQGLVNRNLWDNTIVVITGDHGEQFNDIGLKYWGHGSNFSKYQLQVPLVIHWPGRQGNISYRTSHEDIAPSLMHEALGCNNDIGDHSTGYSLFSEQQRTTMHQSYVSTAVVQGDTVNELLPGFIRSYQHSDMGKETDSLSGLIGHVQRIKSHFRVKKNP